jgi:Tetratricopeptide repeat
METSQRVLGQEHPSTLTSMNNLPFTMKGQDRNMEAIELMAECVQLLNRVVGAEHPHALSSATTLAEWQDLGKC